MYQNGASKIMDSSTSNESEPNNIFWTIAGKLALVDNKYIPLKRTTAIKKFITDAYGTNEQEILLTNFSTAQLNNHTTTELLYSLKTELSIPEHKKYMFMLSAFCMSFLEDADEEDALKQMDIIVSAMNIFEIEEDFFIKVVRGYFLDDNAELIDREIFLTKKP